ncbi:hypothetical protein GQ600_19531 [Phytophthora cactorum]|nr:hypothetical protein GQ600_19531 [Phytophthora cactorum]
MRHWLFHFTRGRVHRAAREALARWCARFRAIIEALRMRTRVLSHSDARTHVDVKKDRDANVELLGVWGASVDRICCCCIAAPRLEITFPAQHSWWQVNNDDELLETLPIYFQTRNFRIPENGFLLVTGDNIPEEQNRHISDANSLFLGGIDPGTHFWKLELRLDVTLHVEVWVDPSDGRSTWRYNLRENEKRPIVFVNPSFTKEIVLSTREILPGCYVSYMSSAFECQRRMWLQIMEGLGRRSTVDFRFEVKTLEKVPLHRSSSSIVYGPPLEIPRKELFVEEGIFDGPIEALINSFYSQYPTTRHDSR